MAGFYSAAVANRAAPVASFVTAAHSRAIFALRRLRQNNQLGIGKFRHLLLLCFQQHPLSPAQPRSGHVAAGWEKGGVDAPSYEQGIALLRGEVQSLLTNEQLPSEREPTSQISARVLVRNGSLSIGDFRQLLISTEN